jgi:hypothetical protein
MPPAIRAFLFRVPKIQHGVGNSYVTTECLHPMGLDGVVDAQFEFVEGKLYLHLVEPIPPPYAQPRGEASRQERQPWAHVWPVWLFIRYTYSYSVIIPAPWHRCKTIPRHSFWYPPHTQLT